MISRIAMLTLIKQNAAAVAVSGVLLTLLGVFAFSGDNTPQRGGVKVKDDKIVFADLAGGREGDKALWTQNQSEFTELQDRMKRLEADKKADSDRIDDMKKRLDQAVNARATDQENFKKTLDIEIKRGDDLAKRTAEGPRQAGVLDAAFKPGATYPNGNPFRTAGAGGVSRPEPEGPMAGSDDVKLEKINLTKDAKKTFREFDVSSYVPAGAYAPVKIISGADATVAVKAQEHPLPLLVRVTGPAISAASGGEVEETDITGCLITIAGYAELSSEKVYGRLERMTCTKGDHKVFETDVKGYLAALGKVGVRGKVVSREGDFILQAFLAGMAGGLGKGVAATTAQTSYSPLGAVQTPASDVTSMLKSGFGQGASDAGSKIETYLIQRAEQYQSVVEVNGGVDAEIVFTSGTFLDGSRKAGAQ